MIADVYTTGQIGSLLGLSTTTVQAMCRDGLKHFCIPRSRARRVLHSELVAYLKARSLSHLLELVRNTPYTVLLIGAEPGFGRELSLALGKPWVVLPAANTFDAGYRVVAERPAVIVLPEWWRKLALPAAHRFGIIVVNLDDVETVARIIQGGVEACLNKSSKSNSANSSASAQPF